MKVPDSGQTIIDGRKLAWRETGNGCPLVSIHEVGVDIRRGPELAKRCRVHDLNRISRAF